MQTFRDVDPAELRPPTQQPVADPVKLARQISRYGRSAAGMPPIQVFEGSDGVLMIWDGVTRAARIAKLAPGQLVRVEIIGRLPRPHAGFPSIKDTLP